MFDDNHDNVLYHSGVFHWCTLNHTSDLDLLHGVGLS